MADEVAPSSFVCTEYSADAEGNLHVAKTYPGLTPCQCRALAASRKAPTSDELAAKCPDSEGATAPGAGGEDQYKPPDDVPADPAAAPSGDAPTADEADAGTASSQTQTTDNAANAADLNAPAPQDVPVVGSFPGTTQDMAADVPRDERGKVADDPEELPDFPPAELPPDWAPGQLTYAGMSPDDVADWARSTGVAEQDIPDVLGDGIQGEPGSGPNPFVKGQEVPGAAVPEGDPVLLYTGQLAVAVSDLVVRSPGFPLELRRVYRSGTIYGGPLGFSWDHNYNVVLRRLDDGRLARWSGALREDLFEQQADGSFASPTGLYERITQRADGSARVDAADGSYQEFDARSEERRVGKEGRCRGRLWHARTD